MTQFMLVIGNRPQDPDLVCRSIDEEASRWLQNIARELFIDEQLKSCWYLDRELIHDLFSQAQTQLFAGESIEQTSVGQLLLELFRSCEETVLWYSIEFDDLPEFRNIEAAMNEISTQLIRPSGEIYLRFRNSFDK
jgi:hypothetical protein